MDDKYFKQYESREMMIAENVINDLDWLKSFVLELRKDNTPFHDLIMVLEDGKEISIEIKEDEYYWFNRTGNVGLDYLSAFTFNSTDIRKKWLKNNFWIKKQDLNNFKSDITVLKYGKLFTCDADIQLFVIFDKDEIKFSRLYSNEKLRSQDFISHLENNYDLRINNKKDYGLKDNWDSAAYFVNPLTDKNLILCEIKNIKEIY